VQECGTGASRRVDDGVQADHPPGHADAGRLGEAVLQHSHSTRSATQLFADPEFDGDPALITEEEIDADGESVSISYEPGEDAADETAEPPGDYVVDEREPRRKYYVDG
jgi:type I restriction enzyme R subunit